MQVHSRPVIFWVQAQILNHPFNHRLAIIGIVNDKVRRQVHQLAVMPQHPRPKGMKSAGEPQSSGKAGSGFARHFGYPRLHFFRRLVSKGQQNYFRRVSQFLLHQAKGPVGKNLRFSTARPRQNQKRRSFVRHCLPLFLVQIR